MLMRSPEALFVATLESVARLAPFATSLHAVAEQDWCYEVTIHVGGTPGEVLQEIARDIALHEPYTWAVRVRA